MSRSAAAALISSPTVSLSRLRTPPETLHSTTGSSCLAIRSQGALPDDTHGSSVTASFARRRLQGPAPNYTGRSRGSSSRPLSSSFAGAQALTRLSKGRVAPSLQGSRHGGALATQCSVHLSSPDSLQWILVVASTFLMLAAETPVYKQLLVPLVALLVPQELVLWIRGEYGLWVAFLAVLVRLFYGIPAQLELPFAAFLVVLAAPGPVLEFRHSPAAVILAAVFGCFVAWTHFRQTKTVGASLRSNVVATSVAATAVLVIPIIFLIKGYYIA